jgi:hypothetical protein
MLPELAERRPFHLITGPSGSHMRAAGRSFGSTATWPPRIRETSVATHFRPAIIESRHVRGGRRVEQP